MLGLLLIRLYGLSQAGTKLGFWLVIAHECYERADGEALPLLLVTTEKFQHTLQ